MTARSTAAEELRGTESANRVADILNLFSETGEPLGVTQIARRLDLSKAVVHRILQSLVSRSFLQGATGGTKYVLGPSAIALGVKAWSHSDLYERSAPILQKLRDETGEGTTLSILVGRSRIYLYQFPSNDEVKLLMEIGRPFPLHSGASSRSILAHLPEPYIRDAVRELQLSGKDEVAYRNALEVIRTKGYAMSVNERKSGLFSIAAPIFDATSSVFGSVSFSGLAFRAPVDDLEEQAGRVIAAAKAITSSIRGV